MSGLIESAWLENVDLRDYGAKDYTLGSWLVENLFSRKEVPWATTKNGISMSDFTT